MKQLNIFMAIIALTFIAFFPAAARADNGLDDLDVTLVIVNNSADLVLPFPKWKVRMKMSMMTTTVRMSLTMMTLTTKPTMKILQMSPILMRVTLKTKSMKKTIWMKAKITSDDIDDMDDMDDMESDDEMDDDAEDDDGDDIDDDEIEDEEEDEEDDGDDD